LKAWRNETRRELPQKKRKNNIFLRGKSGIAWTPPSLAKGGEKEKDPARGLTAGKGKGWTRRSWRERARKRGRKSRNMERETLMGERRHSLRKKKKKKGSRSNLNELEARRKQKKEPSALRIGKEKKDRSASGEKSSYLSKNR